MTTLKLTSGTKESKKGFQDLEALCLTKGDTVVPSNAQNIGNIYRCCDGRKDMCPYNYNLKIVNNYIHIEESICMYNKRIK